MECQRQLHGATISARRWRRRRRRSPWYNSCRRRVVAVLMALVAQPEPRHTAARQLEGRPARAYLPNDRRDLQQQATVVHSYGERMWLHGGTAAGGCGCQGD